MDRGPLRLGDGDKATNLNYPSLVYMIMIDRSAHPAFLNPSHPLTVSQACTSPGLLPRISLPTLHIDIAGGGLNDAFKSQGTRGAKAAFRTGPSQSPSNKEQARTSQITIANSNFTGNLGFSVPDPCEVVFEVLAVEV